MIFGHSKKQNKQAAPAGQNPAPQQPSWSSAGAQSPQGGYPAGYPQASQGNYAPNAQAFAQNSQGFGQVPQGYPQNSQGFSQVPQGYGQNSQGFGQVPQGYPQNSQGFSQVPQGYARNSQGFGQAPQGAFRGNASGAVPPAQPQAGYNSAFGGYATPAVGGGYFAQNQGAGQMNAGNQAGGYPQGAGSQGYPRMNQAGQGSTGYPPAGPGSAGYPPAASGGYPPQNGYGYPRQGGYPPQNPYPAQGGQSFAGYPQMGRTPPQAPGAAAQQQIPLNGGGYIPPSRKVSKPFNFNNARLLTLSAVLLLLFIIGLVAKVPVLLWIFAVLAVASVVFFWVRPMIDTNKRLCFTIIFAALTVAAGVTLYTWSGAGQTDPVNQPGGGAAVTTQASGSGVVVDPKTGQAVVTVAPEQVTATPAPAQNDSAATDRLESFFYYWSVNKQDDMLTLCSPSWLSSVENARTALFQLMANRTPLDYTVEKISGTVDDTSRTVTVSSTMDRNNGKDPVKYRLSVLMVREGEIWYVDPQSLKTYEKEETPDPAQAATPTPTVEPAADPGLVLYYNPNGGAMYHRDQNCKSTHAKFLPFKGHFTYAEINDAAYKNLEPCNICGAPLRP